MFLQNEIGPECHVTPFHSQSLKSINKENHNFTRVLLDRFTLEIKNTVEDNRKDRTKPQRGEKKKEISLYVFLYSGVFWNCKQFALILIYNPNEMMG